MLVVRFWGFKCFHILKYFISNDYFAVSLVFERVGFYLAPIRVYSSISSDFRDKFFLCIWFLLCCSFFMNLNSYREILYQFSQSLYTHSYFLFLYSKTNETSSTFFFELLVDFGVSITFCFVVASMIIVFVSSLASRFS